MRVSDETLEVRYDLLRAAASRIEEIIVRIITDLGTGCVERIHRSFGHFIGEEQLTSTGSARVGAATTEHMCRLCPVYNTP